MDIVIVSIVALLASALTFFSGFGLGTLLTPVFLLFFPVEIAIALTGVVHLLNNVFKLGLIGSNISWPAFIRFGLPAIIGAFFGAKALFLLSDYNYQIGYELMGWELETNAVKLVIAIVLLFFALAELLPFLIRFNLGKSMMAVGGLLSGFFGGLSGNQGALRSVFLIRMGLNKKAFIATGVIIACVVDITRIPVYVSNISAEVIDTSMGVMTGAVLSAFVGALVGKRLLKKVTLESVQLLVGFMIMGVAVGLGLGII